MISCAQGVCSTLELAKLSRNRFVPLFETSFALFLVMFFLLLLFPCPGCISLVRFLLLLVDFAAGVCLFAGLAGWLLI
jgi:hypothetical protein